LLALDKGDRDVVCLEAECGHVGHRLLSPHLCKLRKSGLIKRWALGGPPVYSLTVSGRSVIQMSAAIEGVLAPRESTDRKSLDDPEPRLGSPLVSHPARFRILCLLGERERETRQICEALGNLKLPAVSQHLSVLREGLLVRSRRQGKRNVYTLTEAGLRILKASERSA
jgi:DNA-binding transcriptional ArsR family regulator